MVQIYGIISDMMMSDWKISLDNVEVSLMGSGYRVEISGQTNRYLELTGMEKAFICTMIACSREDGRKQLSFLMKRKWFMSKVTYYKVVKQLTSKNVIVRLSGSNRFVLNPDYHPSLSKSRMEDLTEEVNHIIRLRCIESLNLSDLRNREGR
jgi:flagellar assembly factor FliW